MPSRILSFTFPSWVYMLQRTYRHFKQSGSKKSSNRYSKSFEFLLMYIWLSFWCNRRRVVSGKQNSTRDFIFYTVSSLCAKDKTSMDESLSVEWHLHFYHYCWFWCCEVWFFYFKKNRFWSLKDLPGIAFLRSWKIIYTVKYDKKWPTEAGKQKFGPSYIIDSIEYILYSLDNIDPILSIL